MGLFELSSWGEEEKKGKKKKHFQKQKKFPDKEKLNISKKGKISKSKKKKFNSSLVNIIANEIQESKKEQNVQKKKKKFPLNNSSTLTKIEETVKKRKKSKIIRKTFPTGKKFTFEVKKPLLENLGDKNKMKNKKKKLKNKRRSLESEKNLQAETSTKNVLENKSSNSPVEKKVKKRKFKLKETTGQFLGKLDNLKNAITSRGKNKSNKRKRLEFEEKEIGETKKRKKSKNPVVDDSMISGEIVKKAKNVQSKSNLKINVKKLKGILENKQKEKKKRMWDNSPSTLRERMMAQLRSSRFRFINETLYNNTSFESKKYFKDDPEAFNAYHEGYKQQVANWPLNPVDIIIESIKKMPKDHVVADFGCGEAKIAESVSQTVHSFDFIALNDKVKVCDMAHTPLLKNGVNIVVFCLSLMGTNLNDYLLEANRVLKKGGIMKIAEVESRFENIEEFVKLVGNYGFINTWTDLSNDLFYFLDFKKEKDVEKGKKKLPAIGLKSCLYKKR